MDSLSHQQTLPRMTDDTSCHSEHGFSFHDELTLVLCVGTTATSLSVTPASEFSATKSEQIHLPKKVYHLPLPSKFRKPSVEPDRIQFLEVSSSFKYSSCPLWKARGNFPSEEMSCYLMPRHTHLFKSHLDLKGC
jgi:hypothetical protein